ncbi:hypothetical protein [Prauserella alba]|uniref:Uncharacterized protein n=1 Tax=Prauserella alba TaxID=176898 RepID=A0ABP4G4D7_9PSEU|nr:hypothetical protein [Prauserella alba]
MDRRGEQWLAANPHMKFYNQRRGCVRCTVDRENHRADYRVVPYVTRPGAPVSTPAGFVVENGKPGVHEV